MGEIWREELEIPNLEKMVFDLYEQIKPLYNALHAVVRHKLFLKYGPTEVDPKGAIPIHLLGDDVQIFLLNCFAIFILFFNNL